MKKTDWNLAHVPLDILAREFKHRRRIDILERLMNRERERIAKAQDKIKAAAAEIEELKGRSK